MCGSIAIVALDQQGQRQILGARDELSKRIDDGLAQIKHRGPDAQGQWISPSHRIALAHVRLNINDLSPSGNQPLHNSSQTVHAVVNGEIYDYDQIRADMIDKQSYEFQGRSDCELVLALYQYYGTSFVSHLRGEFALSLYDSQRDLFLAVRDRYGIKPLFWTVVGGELLVAAEMKALKPLGWKPEWNIKAIIDGSFQIGPTTIFKNVQKVQPGHMIVSRHGGPVTEMQYWEMDYPNKLTPELRTEQDMIEGVRSRLLDAIRVRLRADVKVGVALSGGIDSSVVAGMVNHLIRKGEKIGSDAISEKLSCFGIAFDEDSGFDESLVAKRTADHLGVRFHKKHMTEQDLADNFENATWLDEQPNPDLNFIGMYALSELVRGKGFRVILNGQGADEIFAGYPMFLVDYLRESDGAYANSRISETSRKIEKLKAETSLRENFPIKPGGTWTSARRNLANTLTPVLMASAFPRMPFNASAFPQDRLNLSDTLLSYSEAIPPRILDRMRDEWHPLHTAQYVFCKAHLDNMLLSNLGDRGEMAHSIEGRTPFLDHHLAEYANSLPPSMKIRPFRHTPQKQVLTKKGPTVNESIECSGKYEFRQKYILREAARPFITDEIYEKQKHPYSAPVVYSVDGPLHKLMRKLITKDNVENLGFFDWFPNSPGAAGRSLGHMIDEAFADKSIPAFKQVICLAQWVVLGQRFGVERVEASLTRKRGFEE